MFRSLQGLLIICVMGCVLACADEPGDSTRHAGIDGTRDSNSDSTRKSRTDAVPEIDDLQLQPKIPAPGHVIRAIAHLAEPALAASFTYEWEVDGDENYPNSPSIVLPELQSGTQVRVRVVASNQAGEGASRLAVGTVPNTPPQITKLEILEVDLPDGTHGWHAAVETEDRNGDLVDLRFTWFVNDQASSQHSAAFSTAELTRGDQVYVEVVAHDGSDDGRALRSGVLGIANSAPEITSIPTGLSSQGTFRYQLEVMDPDGDVDLRFALDTAPPGMTLGRGGALRWDPETHQVGDHRVIVHVTDGRGGQATQEFVLPVRITEIPDPSSPASID